MTDKIQKDPKVILCDMCTGEDRKPARKTCMKCEISMCVQHLQAHLTTPVLLQTHPLTEPMSLCGTTKCPQHGKLLEYYCLDDLTCVCVSCSIEQHRLHNMKTFSTAHKELMEKLNAEQQALLVKTDDENVSLEKWEKSEREKLGRSSLRLIQAVTSLRDVALTSVQSSVSARMVSIKTSKSSLQAAEKEKDTFRFLQMYSQVHQDVEKTKTVDLRKGLEPGSDRDKLVQEIKQNGEKIVKQAGLFWGSLLSLVDPENHEELVPTSSDLIFDSKTLGHSMSLSKDNRKVFYNSWLGPCSATLLIRDTESIHTFQRQVPNFQRWMVSLSQDFDWTIGLCDKQSAMNLMNGHAYGLCCKGNQLSSLTTEYDEVCIDPDPFHRNKLLHSPQRQARYYDDYYDDALSVPAMTKTKKQQRVSSALITYHGTNGEEAVPRPEMVEVFWNFAASSLSFFSRTRQHQRKEIITIKMSLNNRGLVPFVQLGQGNSQNVTQRQRMSSPVRTTRQAFPFQPDYSGASDGRTCITEVVCELQ